MEHNVVRAAWAVTTAAASFTWADIGHMPDDPYASTQLFTTYPNASKAVDVHAHIMTEVRESNFWGARCFLMDEKRSRIGQDRLGTRNQKR
jgi:hypothetical protein